MRVTPEMIAGIRGLVAKTPRGLRPVEVPGEVVHSLAEALFALGELQAAVERLKTERDEAMTLLRESQRLAGEATQQALDSATRLGTMADAARGLLASMHDVHVCHACRAIATRRLWNEPGMSWFGCDEHGATHSEDLPHAPSIRALRALLEGKP